MEKSVLVKKYKFTTKKSFVLSSVLPFLLFGLFYVFYSTLGTFQTEIQILSGACFAVAIYLIKDIYGGRFIRLYNDKIEIPMATTGRKINSLPLSKIQLISDMTNYNLTALAIHYGSSKPILLDPNKIDPKDLKDLFEQFAKNPELKNKIVISNEFLKNVGKTDLVRMFVFMIAFLASVGVPHILHGEFSLLGSLAGLVAVCSFILFEQFIQRPFFQIVAHFQRENRATINTPESKKIRSLRRMTSAALAAVFLIFIPFGLSYQEELLSYSSFFIHSLILTPIFIFGISRLLPDADACMSKIETTGHYIVLVFLGYFGLAFFEAGLNVMLDSSSGIRKESQLFASYQKELTKDTCYRLKHWEEEKPMGKTTFCTSDYPRIQEGESFEFVVHDGRFKTPWFSDVHLVRYQSVETFISKLKDENELRQNDFMYLSGLFGLDVWDSYLTRWQKSCLENDAEKCRLSSYVYSLKGNHVEAKKVALQGCNLKSHMSCFAYFQNREASREEKLAVKTMILENCKQAESEEQTELCEKVKAFN